MSQIKEKKNHHLNKTWRLLVLLLGLWSSQGAVLAQEAATPEKAVEKTEKSANKTDKTTDKKGEMSYSELIELVDACEAPAECMLKDVKIRTTTRQQFIEFSLANEKDAKTQTVGLFKKNPELIERLNKNLVDYALLPREGDNPVLGILINLMFVFLAIMLLIALLRRMTSSSSGGGAGTDFELWEIQGSVSNGSGDWDFV